MEILLDKVWKLFAYIAVHVEMTRPRLLCGITVLASIVTNSKFEISHRKSFINISRASVGEYHCDVISLASLGVVELSRAIGVGSS